MSIEKEFYCKDHQEILVHSVEYTTKLDNLITSVGKIEKTLVEATRLRVSWWVAILGVVSLFILQLIVTVFFAGGMVNQIKVNTDRITHLEESVYGK